MSAEAVTQLALLTIILLCVVYALVPDEIVGGECRTCGRTTKDGHRH